MDGTSVISNIRSLRKFFTPIRRVDGTLASGVAVPRLVVRGCTHDAYTV